MRAPRSPHAGLILSAQAAPRPSRSFRRPRGSASCRLDDMVLSEALQRLRELGEAAAITFMEMPAEAYDQLAAGLTKDALKRQGIDVSRARP